MTCTGIQDEVQWPPRSALNLDLGGGAGTAGIALGTGHNSAVPLNDRWKRFQNAFIFRWLPFARPIQVSSCLIMYSIIMYYLDCSLHQTPRSTKNTSFNIISVTLMYLQVSLFSQGGRHCNLLMLQMETKSHHPELSHQRCQTFPTLRHMIQMPCFSWELAGICCLALLRARMLIAEHRRSSSQLKTDQWKSKQNQCS